MKRYWYKFRVKYGKELGTGNKKKVSEEYLKTVVIHTLVEWEHLYTFLPDLYAEYKDQPMDAD